MATIEEVKKRKLSLEKTIFDAIKGFEKDGVTIDYVSIQRDWEKKDEEGMTRLVSEAPIMNEGDGNIIGVKVDLKIDLD